MVVNVGPFGLRASAKPGKNACGVKLSNFYTLSMVARCGYNRWVPVAPISEAAEMLGQRFRARRKLLSATQEQVAEYSGVDVTTIRKIERGQRNPNLHNILRIASTLGLDLRDVFKGMNGAMVPPKDKGPSPLEQMIEIRRQHGIG